MSKMSELDLCIGELRNAAKSLTVLADNLAALFGGSGNAEFETPAKASTASAQSQPSPKAVTLEQVRAILAEKSRSGHTAEVRELLLKHGAAKLSEIDPAEFDALLGDAVTIGLGEDEDG
ncbi:DNA ligase [Dehalococcoides mccartyi]|uniref:DNA ligase n=1 Tax=Dehalococcoides mccartyi TaxID=61435 RepID=UPI00099007B0|nr:DNA ligase [Dehalococcoides mccartyi]AQU05381.1 DNA ligase [Dehalococcoides mccartyi]AQU06834.1 DNA ligase [Dehalococcoides mccartyi]